MRSSSASARWTRAPSAENPTNPAENAAHVERRRDRGHDGPREADDTGEGARPARTRRGGARRRPADGGGARGATAAGTARSAPRQSVRATGRRGARRRCSSPSRSAAEMPPARIESDGAHVVPRAEQIVDARASTLTRRRRSALVARHLVKLAGRSPWRSRRPVHPALMAALRLVEQSPLGEERLLARPRTRSRQHNHGRSASCPRCSPLSPP